MGHAGERITDRYSKLAENVELRKEWTRRAGLGFELDKVGHPAPKLSLHPKAAKPGTRKDPQAEIAVKRSLVRRKPCPYFQSSPRKLYQLGGIITSPSTKTLSREFFFDSSDRGQRRCSDGFLSDLPLSAPSQKPVVIIYNVLHEEIDRIEGARDLWNQDLRGRQWQHADLSGLSVIRGPMRWDKSSLGLGCTEQISRKLLFVAQIAFSYAAGANFRGADLRECSFYRAEIGLGRRHSSADFTDALVNEATDIPEHKVFGERRL